MISRFFWRAARWYAAVSVVLIIALAVLVPASYLTTRHYWTGGFVDGEIRITVVNAAGEPLPSATLRISNSHSPEHDYIPFGGKPPAHEWKTNAAGQIILIQRHLYTFGGFSWSLFWVIPMGAQGPRLECTLAADGYEPMRFPIRRLYHTPHEMREDFPVSTTSGLPIYDNRFVLHKA